MTRLEEGLRAVLPAGAFVRNEPMHRHTTFRVGGPADYFTEPEDVRQLAAILRLCRSEGTPYFILGNGSNLLVSDDGWRGVIVAFGKHWTKVSCDGTRLTAGAGAALSAAARAAWQAGLTGLEFAAGIPGTVGGACVMNAGAYGGEMKQVLSRVTVLTPEGETRTLPAGELELGYRTSCIPARGYVVLEAEFALAPGEPEQIRAVMDDLAARRREKQPLEYPSAGSTFKRPEGYFAGKLIQDAGLRGFSVGGAQVSEKHCGFVINRSGASALDIYRLCCVVQERVRERFGVELEPEVKLLGEFDEGSSCRFRQE